MHIVFCANSAFFRHLGVAALSIAEHSGGREISIHVVTGDNCPVEEDRLVETLEAHPNVGIQIYNCSTQRLNGCFVGGRISKDSYLRILLPDVLPKAIEKVIYLDCDVIVKKSLYDLWSIDLQGKVIAAVRDIKSYVRAVHGIPDNYVNAGVLVIDLDKWRKDDLTNRILKYCERMGSELVHHDQDAINKVLKRDILLIGLEYNYPAMLDSNICKQSLCGIDIPTTDRVAVVHFIGPDKPWIVGARTSGRRDYLRLLRRTAWARDVTEVKGLMARLYRWIDLRLVDLGVDNHWNSHVYPRIYNVGRRALAVMTGSERPAPPPV